ncbi:Williams-Beuren syndrome chromosomal region 27 protein [Mizuhopecten yessoensis]|uniref:Williams-Beuren syndrome chromosomal region 27 protein n=1 Tax=Mizuhopecten yessoensis TaxID=6573 RepID=A0A210PNV1_MIZYE|nr:Williams-Beuren syndrome chromosomal region 27 protein [Mizuhopecten yessoensis]
MYVVVQITQKYNDVIEEGYTAHLTTAGVIGDVFPDGRETKEILDIAAGTGLVADELKKMGFRLIDALEPSKGMLELAVKKYRNVFNQGLSKDPLPFPSDKYDAITICGWHGSAGPLADSLSEMTRVVKPGGYICIVTRMHYVQNLDDYKETFLPECIKLEADGKWKQLEFKGFMGYPFNNEGVKMVFRVC